jgi:hypothetical protein
MCRGFFYCAAASPPAWRARLMTDWKRVRFVGDISVPADIVYQQTDN